MTRPRHVSDGIDLVIVIETSAIVDALVGDSANPALLALIADEDLHASTVVDDEVASALRGHVLSGKLDSERMNESIQDFGDITINRHPLSTMMPDVLGLGDNYTVCDAAYLVLAHALGASLVTADTKLADAANLGIDVRVFRP